MWPNYPNAKVSRVADTTASPADANVLLAVLLSRRQTLTSFCDLPAILRRMPNVTVVLACLRGQLAVPASPADANVVLRGRVEAPRGATHPLS